MSDQTPNDPQPDEPEVTPEAAAPSEPTEQPAIPEPTPEIIESAAEFVDAIPEPAAEAEAVVEADAVYVESSEDDDEDDEPAIARVKPAIPGMDLEVDIVGEGEDPLGREGVQYDEDGEPIIPTDESDIVDDQPIAAEIVLAADARYSATGKRKSAVGRVLLKPGTGVYTINGKPMDAYFPRPTLLRNIRQPLEAVGYDTRMDVIASMHGGGVSAQAGALRHGISRALLEADPNLRGELKRRGFLTRDPRVKERKKAGLKKARKKPQFSKR